MNQAASHLAIERKSMELRKRKDFFKSRKRESGTKGISKRMQCLKQGLVSQLLRRGLKGAQDHPLVLKGNCALTDHLKITFLGKAEAAMKLGIKSWWDLAQVISFQAFFVSLFVTFVRARQSKQSKRACTGIDIQKGIQINL